MVDSYDDDEVADTVQTLARLVFSGLTIDGALSKLRRYPKELLDLARDKYERELGIIAVADPGSLVDDPSNRWYVEPSDAVVWPALRDHLSGILPEQALEDVSKTSRKVVSLGSPPGRNPVRTRGLVLGYVQSGKTTNYMSVIARAADIGYRLVIVLTGITENLRSQTQSRIEASLVDTNPNYWYMLTGESYDFSEVGKSSTLLANNHLLAVVKKNPARLRRLAKWIEGAAATTKAECPILVIDDEADQASVNTGKNRRSTINALILRILENNRAQYIAYTATPFANLLIDATESADLYPRDFIVPLPQPVGYFGSDAIFGNGWVNEDGTDRDGYDVVRRIPAAEVSDVRPTGSRDAGWHATAPASLRSAIEWFVMSTAARRARLGQAVHSSMLVHTTMRADDHFGVRDACASFLRGLRTSVREGDPGAKDRLKKTWESEASRVPSEALGNVPIDFDTVWNELPNVLGDIETVVDNYKSTDRLNYGEEPRIVLVVGGNTLSRGLTLEGLTCSYFVRSASAYDTLLQMGRWFGFRLGYEDLVRLWITEELLTWFSDLARVEEQIREEIAVYEREGKRPVEVPVRIRTHPQMMITSAAKMQNAVMATVSYSARFVQTIMFRHRDREWLDGNIAAVKALVEEAKSAGVAPDRKSLGRPTLFGVPHPVIFRFLTNYQADEGAVRFNTQSMAEYIRREVDSGSLTTWNVVFMEPASGRLDSDIDFGLGPVRLGNRAKLDFPEDKADLKAIASTADRIADLDIPMAEIRKFLHLPDGKRATDSELLRARTGTFGSTGLLCLYPIDKDSRARSTTAASTSQSQSRPGAPRLDLDAVQHLVGAAAFFPQARHPANLVEAVTARVPEPLELFEDEADLADALDEDLAAHEDQP